MGGGLVNIVTRSDHHSMRDPGGGRGGGGRSGLSGITSLVPLKTRRGDAMLILVEPLLNRAECQ
jgi:hypothetical protein